MFPFEFKPKVKRMKRNLWASRSKERYYRGLLVDAYQRTGAHITWEDILSQVDPAGSLTQLRDTTLTELAFYERFKDVCNDIADEQNKQMPFPLDPEPDETFIIYDFIERKKRTKRMRIKYQATAEGTETGYKAIVDIYDEDLKAIHDAGYSCLNADEANAVLAQVKGSRLTRVLHRKENRWIEIQRRESQPV